MKNLQTTFNEEWKTSVTPTPRASRISEHFLMLNWHTTTSAERHCCSLETNGLRGLYCPPLTSSRLTGLSRSQTQSRGSRPPPRSRSNTVRSYTQYVEPAEEVPPVVEVRPSIKSGRTQSNRYELPTSDHSAMSQSPRPHVARSTTYDNVHNPHRDLSPANIARLSRVPSDSLMIRTARSQLRNVEEQDVFADDSGSYTNSSPDHGYGEQSVSPATSHGSGSFTPLTGKKSTAPPPPPSRAKKPPPPPVPAKRTVFT